MLFLHSNTRQNLWNFFFEATRGEQARTDYIFKPKKGKQSLQMFLRKQRTKERKSKKLQESSKCAYPSLQEGYVLEVDSMQKQSQFFSERGSTLTY